MLNTASGPAQGRARAPGGRRRDRLQGHRLGPQGLGRARLGLHPGGPDRVLARASATQQDIAKAKALLKQAGYGSGGKKLTLVLTLANGDADEALTASIIKSDLRRDRRRPERPGARVADAVGARASRPTPSKRQDIFLFYWYPDYADPFSWFINLFHSANPPYFNLSYLREQAGRRDDRLAAGDDRDEPREGQTPPTSSCRSAARPGRRRPAVRAELRADLPEVDDRLRRQPRLLQRRVHLRPASRRDVTRFLARRLAQAVIVIVGVVIVTFAVARLVPGDPAVTYAGPRASQAQLAQVTRQLGLDRRLARAARRLRAGSRDRRLGDGAAHAPAGARRPGDCRPGLARARDRRRSCWGSRSGCRSGSQQRAAAAAGRDAVIRLLSMLSVSMPVFWLGTDPAAPVLPAARLAARRRRVRRPARLLEPARRPHALHDPRRADQRRTGRCSAAR